jgi:hypothetical protein
LSRTSKDSWFTLTYFGIIFSGRFHSTATTNIRNWLGSKRLLLQPRLHPFFLLPPRNAFSPPAVLSTMKKAGRPRKFTQEEARERAALSKKRSRDRLHSGLRAPAQPGQLSQGEAVFSLDDIPTTIGEQTSRLSLVEDPSVLDPQLFSTDLQHALANQPTNPSAVPPAVEQHSPLQHNFNSATNTSVPLNTENVDHTHSITDKNLSSLLNLGTELYTPSAIDTNTSLAFQLQSSL